MFARKQLLLLCVLCGPRNSPPPRILGSSYTRAPIGQLRMTTSPAYMYCTYTFSSVSLGLLWRHLLARAGPAVNSPSMSMTAHTRSNGPTTRRDHILITGQTKGVFALLYVSNFLHFHTTIFVLFPCFFDLIFLKFTKNLHQDYLHYIILRKRFYCRYICSNCWLCLRLLSCFQKALHVQYMSELTAAD